MIPKCPDCQAPLWLRACKCGWQSPDAALRRYARQAALYVDRATLNRPWFPER